MKSIFDYSSFRKFLKEGYLREKKASKHTTLALYAKRFKMSAASLNMIFSGSRNLTLQNLHFIAKTLKLSKEEHEYFEAMVLREQSKQDPIVSRYYSQKMKNSLKSVPIKNVRISDRAIVSDWLLPVLLLYLVDFEFKKNNAKEMDESKLALEIAAKFHVSVERLVPLFKVIKTSDLIQIQADDQVHIMFEKITSDTPQREYFRNVLKQQLDRLDSDFKRPDTMSRAFAFTVEKSAIPDLRLEITAVFERFMSKVSEQTEENTLLQAYAGYFPVMD
jgi:uncharacterized protein (TIGR02147 family)